MDSHRLSTIRWRDLALTAVFAACIAVALRVFVLSAYTIPSHSMENTILHGDYIVMSKITYLMRDVRRGDVIIFSLPDSLRNSKVLLNPDELYIKRVVGMPGDTLVLTHESITINDTLQPTPPEARPPFDPLLKPKERARTIIVPPDHYFVMGDNRSNSYDSRSWGMLPSNHIVGSPLFVYWSYGDTPNNPADHIRWDRLLQIIK
jgi:signal peptidase I